MSKINKINDSYFKFVCKRYKAPLIAVASLFILCIVLPAIHIDKLDNDAKSFSFLTSIFIALSTISFTIYSSVKDWHQSFRKYMDVIYYKDDAKVLEIRNVSFLGEGDIRAYAQQIGKQANTLESTGEMTFLDLFPKFEYSSELQKDKRRIQYTVKMKLSKEPGLLKEKTNGDYNGKYLYWDTTEEIGVEVKSI